MLCVLNLWAVVRRLRTEPSAMPRCRTRGALGGMPNIRQRLLQAAGGIYIPGGGVGGSCRAECVHHAGGGPPFTISGGQRCFKEAGQGGPGATPYPPGGSRKPKNKPKNSWVPILRSGFVRHFVSTIGGNPATAGTHSARPPAPGMLWEALGGGGLQHGWGWTSHLGTHIFGFADRKGLNTRPKLMKNPQFFFESKPKNVHFFLNMC